MLLRSHSRTTVEQTLRALPALHDRGIIQSIDWYPLRADDPQFFHCIATVGVPGEGSGKEAAYSAGGTALTKDAALAKAIGEAIERYCASAYDPSRVTVSPYRKLGSQAIDPRRFDLFSPDQRRSYSFPFEPVTEDSDISWVPGYSLTRDEATLVPASLVFLNPSTSTPGDRFELAPVSGYACGNTLEEAILGCIYEVIERDAFMIFWYNWLPVPGIDLGSRSMVELEVALLRYQGVPCYLFCSNITADSGVPTVLAAITTQQPGRPIATVATAANLDPEQAILHALLELAANRLFIAWHLQSGARKLPSSPWEISLPEDHGLLYSQRRYLPYLDLVLRPRWVVPIQTFPSKSSEDVKTNIQTCLQRLAALDLEVIVVDITTKEVEELGFNVVKVLVPGMQPIDFGVSWPHLGGRRLYEAPLRMGYAQLKTRPDQLNRFPHPFP